MAYIFLETGLLVEIIPVDDLSDHRVTTLIVRWSSGELRIMGEVTCTERTIKATGVHVDATDPSPGLNMALVRKIARQVMEGMDFDELIIEGAPRTTGASPGRRPRPLRFSRRSSTAP